MHSMAISTFPAFSTALLVAGYLALPGCTPPDPLDADPAPTATLEEAARRAGIPSNIHPLWGDIHAHSNISADAPDSVSPIEMYEEMRDQAGLDFGAVTDHDMDLGGWRWQATKIAANGANCEGPRQADSCPGGRHFVSLLGYEWTSHLHGHRQVLLYQDAGRPWQTSYELTGDASIPMLGNHQPGSATPCDLWGSYDALTNGSITNFDLLTIAHHPAQVDGFPPRIDWDQAPQLCDTPYPASYQPLVEVFSRHGNSEFSGMTFPDDDPVGCREAAGEGATVREALAMWDDEGAPIHRMGLVGSGDSHDGRPGRDAEEAARVEACPSTPLDGEGVEWGGDAVRIEQTGLVCAYVQASTREQAVSRGRIFDALEDRFTYATTGARITLWTEIAVTTGDGGTRWSRMGQETTLDTAAGEGAVARIHVEKDDEDLERVSLLWLDPATGDWEVCEEWMDPPSPLDVMADVGQDCSSEGWNAYYVKVEQAPARAGAFLVGVEHNGIAFSHDGASYTAELTQGWYDGPEALAAEAELAMNELVPGDDLFVVSYDPASRTFSFNADEPFGLLWSSGADPAAVLMGFDEEDDLEAQAHRSDFALPAAGWTEREMAWSSPIWVEVQ